MSARFVCINAHRWEEPTAKPDVALRCPQCGEEGTPDRERTLTAKVAFTISGTRVQAEINVPAGPTTTRTMLPVFQALANIVVEAGVKAVEEEGKKISCAKGCGACCRQLVPITELEARHLAELLNALPEPRRSTIRERFAQARLGLQSAGLLEKLEHPEQFGDDALRPLGLEYFHQKIPCPFLEDESCSIHPDRPIACREYLVTSPAVHCAQPSAATVECVPLSGKVSNAVALLDAKPNARFVAWVPLILAPSWAESHPDETPTRPGPEILSKILETLTGKPVPPPAASSKSR